MTRESGDVSGAERKQQIVEAAERIFGRRGLQAATTAEVASAVGVSQPALYRYFPSKRELFQAALALRQEKVSGVYAEHLASDATPLEKLRRIGHATIALAHRYPDMARLRLQVTAAAGADAELGKIVRATLDQLRSAHAALLQQAIDAGELAASVDPQLAAWEISGQAYVMYVAITLEHDAADPRFARRAFDAWLDGLPRPA